MFSLDDWTDEYKSSDLPWETNRPSSELQRVISDCRVQQCRTIEVGCGTGNNSVWLAVQGFDVTAIDLSSVAIDEARELARAADVSVNFIVADVSGSSVLSGLFDFFFDCGCYGGLHSSDGPRYRRAIESVTRSRAFGLILMGNAAEPEEELSPSVLEEWQVRAEWSQGFGLRRLRSFRFDPRREGDRGYLGWSWLLQRNS